MTERTAGSGLSGVYIQMEEALTRLLMVYREAAESGLPASERRQWIATKLDITEERVVQFDQALNALIFAGLGFKESVS